MEYEKLFGQTIKNLRLNLNYNAYDFAIQADIGYSNLSKTENGNIPSIEVVLHILNYLNIGFNECVGVEKINNREIIKNELVSCFSSLNKQDLNKLLSIAKIINGNEKL